MATGVVSRSTGNNVAYRLSAKDSVGAYPSDDRNACFNSYHGTNHPNGGATKERRYSSTKSDGNRFRVIRFLEPQRQSPKFSETRLGPAGRHRGDPTFGERCPQWQYYGLRRVCVSLPLRADQWCTTNGVCIAELDTGGSVISVPPKPSEVALKFAAVYCPSRVSVSTAAPLLTVSVPLALAPEVS
jgi:hypothetical protein